MEPQWTTDTEIYYKYCDEYHLVQFLIALQDDFESVRASILCRPHVPTVDTALVELMAKETRKGTLDNSTNVNDSVGSILATPLHGATFNLAGKNSNANRKPSNNMFQFRCSYCKGLGHIKYNRHIKLRKKTPSQGFTAAPASSTPSTQNPTSAYLTT
ncbi:hypothetical protein AMTR_s00079p00122170 [Amborella trichopoda]|uniref:Uncharacterized protein n=1 Tax=Amborella trichopoda TaxID=13333 RepID=W1PAE4_AMBTC|nr:hypothetical protein AMTR_s00079p00122170 [Amborella trichopoda]